MKKNDFNSVAQQAARELSQAAHIAATANQMNRQAARQPKRKKKSSKAKNSGKPRKQSSARPKSAKQQGRLVSKLEKASPGHRNVAAWAGLVSNPFVGQNNVKCPFNFNPAPSLSTYTVTTVNSSVSMIATANNTRQMTIWPGHGPMDSNQVVVGTTGSAIVAQMDEVAYHHQLVQISGVASYNIGPVYSISAAGSTYSTSAAMISGNTAAATNGVVVTTTTGHTNYSWDNPNPITADSRSIGHARWKMIAMGLRIRNITPAIYRGGNVISVQPTTAVNPTDFATQTKFSIFPSFCQWGDGSDGIELSWIPRSRDLAFWHLGSTLSAAGADAVTQSLAGGGIYVWFNAGTYDQTYEFELIAHWELAGAAGQIFSSSAKTSSIAPAQVQGALGAQANGSPSAHGFGDTLNVVAGGVLPRIEKAVSSGVHEAVRAGKAAALGIAKTIVS